ncbi:hypothetical protein AVEN_6458-1 [Araneus ventricosus]|uniref:PiggyBac transposable element-derived protein domain-containing protein n=1 Tax=Araneus ventricosus TaxID=182803 RepID=A0A4Y2SK09_ARAVE|nr:hypothetical protein AVEN_6458-1 [Araneus ventricosus]
MYLIRWQESILLNPLSDDGLYKIFFNILDIAAINAWVIYKEITGTKIKRLDYFLNLADDVQNNYVSSKTSGLSDFTDRPMAGPRGLQTVRPLKAPRR